MGALGIEVGESDHHSETGSQSQRSEGLSMIDRQDRDEVSGINDGSHGSVVDGGSSIAPSAFLGRAAGAGAREEEDEADVVLTEKDLEANVTILLKETETIWMLDLPSTCVMRDTPESAEVIAANDKYRDLKKIRIGNDSYEDRETQTFDYAPKTKEIQAVPVGTRDEGCDATAWDIYDTMLEEENAFNKVAHLGEDGLAEAVGEHGKVKAGGGGGGAGADGGDDGHEDGEDGGDDGGGEYGIGVGGVDDEHSQGSGTPTSSSFRTSMVSGGQMTSTTGTASRMMRSNATMQRQVSGGAAAQRAANSTQGGSGGGGGGDQAGAGAGGVIGIGSGGASSSSDKRDPLAKLRNLSTSLRVVEHMVAQNIFHAKHLDFRNFAPDRANEIRRLRAMELAQRGGDVTPPVGGAQQGATVLGLAVPTFRPQSGLQLLWSYTCAIAQEKNVSCMAFSHQNYDLLAVGYGSFSFTKQTPGAVLCWSPKNPDYPDRVYPTTCGVTAVDFSRAHPYVLAVALYDGTIAIYDVRKTTDKPILASTFTEGKHSEPAWCLRWVDRGADKGEFLISMSTDGRVTQWSLKKGMEFTDLMKLKRVSGQSWSDARKAEGFISRLASGMSFDFRLGDADVYLAGTEEGTIHKCSCSYNEQYLETFSGHSGPVYQIVASPFHPQVFLSASADWTCRLWHLDYDSARLIFEPCTTYIADVAWSPHNSTVFATVTGDGRLDVWDLTVSAIDPVASFSNNGVTKFSRVRFSANTSAVVVGDEAGRVHTFKITNLDTPPLNAEQMKVRLEEAIKLNADGAKTTDPEEKEP